LFINGHLHNGQFLNDKETILNLGNLTGQNFGEDANRYKHFACILDTDTKELTFFENPYALNFYKFDMTDSQEDTILNCLNERSVVSLKCRESDLSKYRDLLNSYGVLANRITIAPDNEGEEEVQAESTLISIDHLALLRSFITEKVEMTKAVKEELSKILEDH
jgi:hypothetical protein